MSVGRNVLAGIANSSWTALIGLAAVPLYIKYLGIESYGLIGFYVTLQAVLQLLDMGLAPTMNREVARCSVAGTMSEARSLLVTLEVLYWITALGIAIIGVVLAEPLAAHWLQAKSVNETTIRHAVVLMSVLVACRWPIGLYQGVIMGTQRLIVSSTLNMASITISTFGAIIILSTISPTVEAFFIWQAVVAMGQVVATRGYAWKFIGRAGAGRFQFHSLQRIWQFSANMSGIAIASILFTQLDKVLLSKMLGLEAFGQYVVAGVLASGLYVLLTPVFNVIYPRMTSLFAQGDTSKLVTFYRFGTRLLASVLFPVAMGIAVFSTDLVLLWTGDLALSTAAGPIVSVLILGTSFNGVMHFPFAMQLAFGRSGLSLAITVSLAVVLVPMIILLTVRFGGIGSAFAWLILNTIYLVGGSWITHRRLLGERLVGWLSIDVGIPFAISAAVVCIGWELLHQAFSGGLSVIVGFALTSLAVLMNLLLLPRGKLKEMWLRGLTPD